MQSQTQLILYIAFGCLVMVSLAMAIILFSLRYRKKMLEKERALERMEREKEIALFSAAIEAEEKQKERIANHLLDEIIPMLGMTLKNSERHLRQPGNGQLNAGSLKKDLETIDQAISRIRLIALDLTPKVLMYFGLAKALDYYTKQLNELENATVVFENSCTLEEAAVFSKSELLGIYRICLELLTNLYKHARYTHLEVKLGNDQNRFLIYFTHNGQHVTNKEIETFTNATTGLGLKSLKSRLLMLDAGIDYTKAAGIPVIRVNIPFNCK